MAAPAPILNVKGMRFHPTDFELIEYFLHDKVDADQADHYSNLIHECSDFYSGEKEPSVIWDMYGGSTYEEGQPLYFYTKRAKRAKQNSTRGIRYKRTVGSGFTWSGEYATEIKARDGTKVGTVRHFRYEWTNKKTTGDASQDGAWFIQEYESEFHNGEDDYVICALRKNPRKAQGDEGDTEVTKKRTRKRTRARSDDVVDDHRTRNQKKKIKEEEIDEVVHVDLEPVNLEKEEQKEETSYEEQGRSNCTQLPEQQQPYHHDQNNTTDYCPELLGNNYGDGISIEDLNGPISYDSPNYKSYQFENQLYHGDDSKFNYVDYMNEGISQLPDEDQLYRGDDSKFNHVDYMNEGMLQLPEVQLYRGDDSKRDFVDYTNGGMSQLPEDHQLYHGEDGKFNFMDYLNIEGMSQLPNDQAAVDYQAGNN